MFLCQPVGGTNSGISETSRSAHSFYLQRRDIPCGAIRHHPLLADAGPESHGIVRTRPPGMGSDGVLELLGGPEGDLLGGSDLDGLAGLRITARAGCALAHLQDGPPVSGTLPGKDMVNNCLLASRQAQGKPSGIPREKGKQCFSQIQMNSLKQPVLNASERFDSYEVRGPWPRLRIPLRSF
jgi:hypothetical protein